MKLETITQSRQSGNRSERHAAKLSGSVQYQRYQARLEIRPTAIVLDIDGTLVPWRDYDYVWQFILSDFVLVEWNRCTLAAPGEGIISYGAWHKRLFERMRDRCITRSELVDSMRHQLAMTPRHMRAVRQLRGLAPLAVLSGSISLALEVAGFSLDWFSVLGCHHLNFDEDGHIVSWTTFEHGGHFEKPAGLREICQRLGVLPRDVVYVGDGFNDREILRYVAGEGGLSFALPPLAWTQEAWACGAISIENLESVVRWLQN